MDVYTCTTINISVSEALYDSLSSEHWWLVRVVVVLPWPYIVPERWRHGNIAIAIYWKYYEGWLLC